MAETPTSERGVLRSPGAISYIVPLAPAETSWMTIFQGFNRRTLTKTEVIQQIARLPSNVFELFVDWERAMLKRAVGASPYEVLFLESDFLESRLPFFAFPCVISDNTTVEAVEAVLRKGPHHVLHVTFASTSQYAVRMDTLTRRHIYDWLQHLRDLLRGRGLEDLLRHLPLDRPLVEWPLKPCELAARGHNITLPNEALLESFAFELQQGDPLPAFSLSYREEDVDRPFVEIIAASVSAIEQRRRHFFTEGMVGPGTTSLIMSVPGVFGFEEPKLLKEVDKQTAAVVRAVFRHVSHQRHYPALYAGAGDIAQILASPFGQALLKERQTEMEAYTAVLSVRAAGSCAPVIRLPPQLSRARERMKSLGNVIRSHGPRKEQKASRLAQQIGKEILDGIPSQLLPFLDQDQTGVKILADVPLELLPVRGIPLSVRWTTSRLPVTPGDLLQRAGLAAGMVVVEAEALSDILLLRAFERNDRLKPFVETAIRSVVSSNHPKLRLKVVDVEDTASFVRALEQSRAPIMIFDGHGQHSSETEVGTLIVGKDRINLGELKQPIIVPPIVILSACETHPMDGNHNTVANAFLYAGAKTVVGTLAPVDAARAALLIGRLVLRLLEFVPLIRSPLCWSEVMGGMLRMSYAWDVLETLVRTHRIPQPLDHLRPVQIAANVAINTFRSDWLETMLEDLSSATSIPAATIRASWREVAYFTESLLYLQLGDPEHIWIRPVEPDEPESRH